MWYDSQGAPSATTTTSSVTLPSTSGHHVIRTTARVKVEVHTPVPSTLSLTHSWSLTVCIAFEHVCFFEKLEILLNTCPIVPCKYIWIGTHTTWPILLQIPSPSNTMNSIMIQCLTQSESPLHLVVTVLVSVVVVFFGYLPNSRFLGTSSSNFLQLLSSGHGPSWSKFH